ncbi:MAG: hypothetical protein GY754_32100 [bacterium]|nr:hypothetical protein [bacterium]
MIKDKARAIIEKLPNNASWDDLMHEIHLQQVIESGLKVSKARRTQDISKTRKKHGLKLMKEKLKERLPIIIPIKPYLLDHRFIDRAVYPAVEALQELAKSTLSFMPDAPVLYMHKASFDRFLFIDPNSSQLEAFNDLSIDENGDIRAKLVTITKTKSGITRAKEHVSVLFRQESPRMGRTPRKGRTLPEADESWYSVPHEDLYRELVPFGPSFQNTQKEVFLCEKGARAALSGGTDAAGSFPLGSPFPLDAAFHSACAWGQRFANIVVFPVGFENRVVLKPTEPGKNYRSCVYPLPKPSNKRILKFDIDLFDEENTLCETISGLKMEDVSRGRMKPPEWIIQK